MRPQDPAYHTLFTSLRYSATISADGAVLGWLRIWSWGGGPRDHLYQHTQISFTGGCNQKDKVVANALRSQFDSALSGCGRTVRELGFDGQAWKASITDRASMKT